MDAPEPEPSESWLQRRGVDLAAWALVILAILGIAGGTAWLLSNSRFEAREVPLPFEEAVDEAPVDSGPEPVPPAPLPVRPPLPASPYESVESGPTWLVQPAPDYPEQTSTRRAVDGEVRLTCMAEISGRLAQCRVIRESPAGYGFGSNAVGAAEQARVTPRKINGVAVRSEITFNIRYRLAP